MQRQILAIATILLCHQGLAQRVDSAFNKDFDRFRSLTDTLILELRTAVIRDSSELIQTRIPAKVTYYCNKVKRQLAIADSHGWLDLKMISYFDKGKPARSQDITSPIAQLECSYYYYTSALRKANNTISQIKAVLILDEWLKNGFPSSMYCPYFYAPVEVNFGPKEISGDTISRKTKQIKQ
jgi:hypothetical protein